MTNGFKPDWKALYEASASAYWEQSIPDAHRAAVRHVIAAYEQQREAAGWVSVRREDLLTIQTVLRSGPRLAEETLAQLDQLLSR